MYFVYIIESEKDNRLYVGFTDNLKRRIQEHNAGKTRSTKGYLPWKIVFFVEVETRIEARKLEKYYKSGYGKEKIKKDIRSRSSTDRTEVS